MKSIKQYDKQCNETHTLITRFNNYRLTANLISTLLPSTSVPPKLSEPKHFKLELSTKNVFANQTEFKINFSWQMVNLP